jgi:hypothetical protein
LRCKSQTNIHSHRGWMLYAFLGCFTSATRFVL